MKRNCAHELLAKAALRGVRLIIDGDRLGYTPRDLMPGVLHDDLQSNQREVRALLQRFECCMAPRGDVRGFVAALLRLARREGDRFRAGGIRWNWRDQVECHLNWPLPRSCAEAAAAMWLADHVIRQRGRRDAW